MRRFEFVAGTSAKFWMTDVEGVNFVVVYGRLGTPGQRKDKAFPSEEAARREMEKKIAEKLREGYSEVSAQAAAAVPQGAKGAAAASAKLELPPRYKKVEVTPEKLAASVAALKGLEESLGKRSWVTKRAGRRALSTLSSIAGADPAAHKPLATALDSLMAKVVSGKPAFSPALALALLGKLDLAAFERGLALWQKASANHPVVLLVSSQMEQLGDPELALRVCTLLVERPERGGSETSWERRYRKLSPHLESYLISQGENLRKYLASLNVKGDPGLGRRVSQMGAPPAKKAA